MLACANADTSTPTSSKGPSPPTPRLTHRAAHSDFTDGEFEAFVDTLEVTTISTGDTRAPNSKP